MAMIPFDQAPRKRFIVGVRYKDNPKIYQFRHESAVYDLEAGNHVVVKSANGLDVVKVVSVIQLADYEDYGNKASAWVVQKVDMTAHDERLKREAKRKELEKAIEARKEQLMSSYVYEVMAQSDPHMANLLNELDKLAGGYH